jgi:hypothetical protein
MNESPAQTLLDIIEKSSAIRPEVTPQEHQQRIADRLSGQDPRLLVYHGLGTGKSLASILAAEQAGDNYGIVAPASLRPNFEKEIEKFTEGSDPEVMSYTGMGMGKQFAKPIDTLIVDEAHRLRNPLSASNKAIAANAAAAKRLMLLSGSPIVNSPTDLAAPISLLTKTPITPKEFQERFIGKKKVSPGFFATLRGISPGEEQIVKNEGELRRLLRGHIDYQPGKAPEGVNINEELVKAPLTREQERIQNAIREKIPLKFLWKLDREFPLTADESKRLNAFMSGLRQISLSTQSFRADKDPFKAFQQSGKLTKALENLKMVLNEDARKKAIIYSNYVNAGLDPYAAALAREKIPYGVFHGGISEEERKKAVREYNEGKLRALLIGPAGAEGLSTKGTSLIQLLDPHWNETRSSQAKGRGLRFDSHTGLPEELKNVKVQRYLSASEEPSLLGRLLGYQRTRTGDEIVQSLAKQKEELNDKFRKILQEEGSHGG